MIERNLSKFGWAILLIGSPLTLWAVLHGDVDERWFALLPPFFGVLLILIHFARTSPLGESKKRMLRVGVSLLFIALGVGMISLASNHVIRGTSIAYGWIPIGFGVAIAIFGINESILRQ